MADAVTVTAGEESVVLKDVSLKLENGVIVEASYRAEIMPGFTMDLKLCLSKHGEVSIEMSEEELKKLELIKALDDFFMGEEELLKNYTAKETVVEGDTMEKSEHVYRFDGALAAFDNLIYASNSASIDYLEQDAVMVYLSLTIDGNTFTYDAEADCYRLSEPVKFPSELADYAIASDISFTMKDGLLTSLSYRAEHYTFLEDSDEGSVTATLVVEKIYSDYGTTVIEAEPIEEGKYESALALFTAEAPRTLTYVDSDVYSATVVYAEDGSVTYEIDDYGEILTGVGVPEDEYLVSCVDAFKALLKELDPNAFIKGTDGFYYYAASLDYEAEIYFDLLLLVVEENGASIQCVSYGSGFEVISVELA